MACGGLLALAGPDPVVRTRRLTIRTSVVLSCRHGPSGALPGDWAPGVTAGRNPWWRCPPCDDGIETLPCECFEIMEALEHDRSDSLGSFTPIGWDGVIHLFDRPDT